MVREKLYKMHQKYLDDANTKPYAKLSEEDAEKISTIKRKLAGPEKERCIRPHNRKDVTAIDQRIAEQRERFTVYCRQKQR